MNESMFEGANESDIVNTIVHRLSPLQGFRELSFRAACWNAEIRVQECAGLIPSFDYRDSKAKGPTYQKFTDKDYYFQRCHLLVEAMEKLGQLSRDSGFDPNANPYLALLDKNWMDMLLISYEFRRRIEVSYFSLKEFMIHIQRENHLVTGGYELRPETMEFVSDDYGVEIYSRRWSLICASHKVNYYERLGYADITSLYEIIFGVQPLLVIDESTQKIIDGFSSWAEAYQDELRPKDEYNH